MNARSTATPLALLALCFAVLTTWAPPAQALTTRDQWIAHAREDLARFWMDARYHGDPVGSFPTFICQDGNIWDPDQPCPSLADAPDWIAGELGRQYVRMVSRQVFTYGIIFHLTGDVQALDLAYAGTRYIREQAWDRESGSVATWLADGQTDPDPGQRTTQSLAYSLLGPAFLYYLTGDQELLPFILAVKEHIFTDYWDPVAQRMLWAHAETAQETRDRIELVAQLDQINAYLLLLTPLLEEELRTQWEGDLTRLVESMLRDFHDPEAHRFFGFLHHEEGRLWGQRHNDFGHTSKAYWMVERTGRLLGRQDWIDLAQNGLADVLTDALVTHHLDEAPDWQRESVRPAANKEGVYHVWSNQPDGVGIAWWEWCELDQAAATLALEDDRWLEALEKTQPTFFAALVDSATGAVLSFPGATKGARAHHWFNGYHAAEHALVGAITAAFVADQEIALYFAPTRIDHRFSAYYFQAAEVGRKRLTSLPGGGQIFRATFRRL